MLQNFDKYYSSPNPKQKNLNRNYFQEFLCEIESCKTTGVKILLEQSVVNYMSNFSVGFVEYFY